MYILYIEDDLKIQHQTARFLRSHNHQVTTFTNAPDALKFARTEPFDVVLCDYRLEHSPNGLTLAEQIRNMYPARPIVMISSFATAEEVSQGYEIEVDAYIKRPISLHELMTKLYAAVERRQSRFRGEAIHIVCGAMVIDSALRTARWHGELLNLTPAEFALLAQLVAKPDYVFSVIDLCALTKATRVSPGEARNLLKQHISRLRQKLSQNGRYAQPIENVRGQGYKWASCAEE